jgi:phospholipase/lecithinase/hemolysin
VSNPSFTGIYAFGDSLSDAGNVYTLTTNFMATQPVSPPYFMENYGTFSAAVFSNGPTWVQDLWRSLGPGTLEPSLAPHLGTDFAYGGAETGPTPQNAGETTVQSVTGLPAQLTQFEATKVTPGPNDLFTLWIGGNDIFDILLNPALSSQQQQTDIADSVSNEIAAVNRLAQDGAKNLLVVDVPDLGKTPRVTSGKADGSNTPSAALDTLASTLSADYNAALNPALVSAANTDGLDLHILDAYSIIDDAVANPGSFGLTNVTDPVWSGSFTDPNSGTLVATGAAQDQYLFFDDFHPTETGQQFIATAALTALSGPPACFSAGTRILTAAGEVRIEQLRAGDRVWTPDSEQFTPVAWLGYRHVDCSCEGWPVRIAAHAFGDGLPHRDLLLSPDHAIAVAGVLIPARALANGVTITRQPLRAVTYWHLELAHHAIVLAQGLPAESYLDTGNRSAFTDAPNGNQPSKPAAIITSPPMKVAVIART